MAADTPSTMLLLLFVSVGVISATPIKFFGDEDSEMPHDMFKALRNVISKFGGHRTFPDNETKPVDLNIESASAFALGPEQMRKLIAKKMVGAELPAADKKWIEKEKVVKEGEKDQDEEKEKEMKRAEQIGCSDKDDCNKTSYCNRLSYTCVACHGDGVICMREDECCEGYTCDDDTNKCQKKKDFISNLDEFEGIHTNSTAGTEGERCTSKEHCGEEYCCALNDNGDGVCQSYLKEGGECGSDPFTTFFSSQSLFAKHSTSELPNKCPCHRDLKCEKRSSFLFVDSSVCTKNNDVKEVKKTDHKSIIKITLRSSPIVRFHTDDDSDPLTSLLPKELMKMLHKPPMRRGFTMRISSHRDTDKKPRKLSARRLSFPFFPFPFSNPFEEQEIDDIKEELKTKREMKRESVADDVDLKRERRKLADDDDMKRERRKLVDDVAEEARASVHRAVDGIFDTIMKKISGTKRNQE